MLGLILDRDEEILGYLSKIPLNRQPCVVHPRLALSILEDIILE
jgi:hypothetical protein